MVAHLRPQHMNGYPYIPIYSSPLSVFSVSPW